MQSHPSKPLLCRQYLFSPRTRNSLRVLTALACGAFVFAFYFVNGVQQQAAKAMAEAAAPADPGQAAAVVVGLGSLVAGFGGGQGSAPASLPLPTRCVIPLYWAGQSSRYTVLYNFAPADLTFGYDESVTYTTHGTARFLQHAETIAKRWQGPVSVAVYSPGTDFDETLVVIQYLRQCREPVRQLVTFHVFYDRQHSPSTPVPCTLDDAVPPSSIDCHNFLFPGTNGTSPTTYQMDHKLTYPVNVARNIARISAQTQYLLPSDIELYPSLGLVPMFLDMIQNRTQQNVSNERTVYVLPIFEVDGEFPAPENKTVLVELFHRNKVVPFHKYVCSECHRVPNQTEWLASVPTDNTMRVMVTKKRHKPHHAWEPIYIGTNDEPLYDERLNWEGMSDKMTQAYELCLMNYDFGILDNAFLVHAPGIKRYSKTASKWRKQFVQNNSKLRQQIKKELRIRYKPNTKCYL